MKKSQLKVSSYDVKNLIDLALEKVVSGNSLNIEKKFIELVKEIKAKVNEKYDFSANSIQRHYYQKVRNVEKDGIERESFQANILDGLSLYVHGEVYASKYTIFFPEEKIYMDILRDLGITSATGKLTESKFNPDQCMARINNSLDFIGIGGGKWVVNDNFEDFLKRLKRKRGKVRFLLLNPNCKEYKNLRNDRGETVRTNESVKLSERYQNEYQENFEVRFYDNLPTFRLVIIDKGIIGMSWYNFDATNTEGKDLVKFREHVGWEAPHLEIQASDADSNKYSWSLFSPFYEYFEREWEKAKKLNETKST